MNESVELAFEFELPNPEEEGDTIYEKHNITVNFERIRAQSDCGLPCGDFDIIDIELPEELRDNESAQKQVEDRMSYIEDRVGDYLMGYI